MIRFIILTTCAAALVASTPQDQPGGGGGGGGGGASVPATLGGSKPEVSSTEKSLVEVLSQDSFIGQDGYNFDFNSSDGTSRHEEGGLVTVGENKGIAVNGSYSYVAPNGQKYLVTFTADTRGYQPTIHLVKNDQPAAV